MPILLHGTTRSRAERIFAVGPDPEFVEPGGSGKADGFSTCLANGPFVLGHPVDYARGKHMQFPGELGPAVLAVDVPDEIIAAAADPFFPLSQGVVQFDRGRGLEQLVQAWHHLPREIRSV